MSYAPYINKRRKKELMNYEEFLHKQGRQTNPEVHAYLARRALALGRIEEARRYIQQSIELPRDVHEAASVSSSRVEAKLVKLGIIHSLLRDSNFAQELLAAIEKSRDFKAMQKAYAQAQLSGNKLKEYVERTETPDKEIVDGFLQQKAEAKVKAGDDATAKLEEQLNEEEERSPELKKQVEEGALQRELKSLERGETREEQRKRKKREDEKLWQAVRLTARRASVADSLHEHPHIYEAMRESNATEKGLQEWDKKQDRLVKIFKLILNSASRTKLTPKRVDAFAVIASEFIHDEQFYSHLIARLREEAEARKGK